MVNNTRASDVTGVLFLCFQRTWQYHQATFYSSLERAISGYPKTAETVEIRLRTGQLLNSKESTTRAAMSSPIRRYLPHLLVGLSISLIMVGAYAAVGFATTSQPKATWAVNPVTITFPATAGTGTKGDSFTCSPSTSGITLIAKASTSNVDLSVGPSSFASCSSSPDAVTLTAHCLVPAAQCRGTYSGLVQIRQPANYRNIPANLAVTIVVT